MHLGKYKDLPDLPIKDLTNYFSARGLNTYGRKEQLAARTFLAFELKMNKIASSDELQ